MSRKLAEWIESVGTVAVLTGAGVSTESGLPDYRGPTGLWKNRRFAELASVDVMWNEPTEFWEFYRMRLAQLADAQPSGAHTAIAQLEQAGICGPVITQNVDGLHTRAGSTALEVHGSLGRTRCTDSQCNYRTDLNTTLRLLEQSRSGIPECPECQSMLRPGVVLFGEPLPEGVINQAFAQVEVSPALLVCGSSLEVWPVAGLVEVAAEAGAQIAIVNIGPTMMDHLAHMRIEAKAGEVLSAAVAVLRS